MILVSNPKFSLQPISDVVRTIEEEFEGWEVFAERYHSYDHKEEVCDALSTTDLELQLHAPLNDINIASLNPSIRRVSMNEVKKSIEMASMLDIEIVTVHPGLYSPLSRYMENASDFAKESLRELKEHSEEHGIKIALENLPEMWLTICNTVKETREFLEEVGLGFCLDIGHAYTAGELEGFLDLSPINVHVHDNIGEKDLHLKLGEGKIDLEKAIRSLKSYEGNYVIEGRNLDDLKESEKYLENILKDI